MLRRSTASPARSRTLLAISLCVLAMVFALEAKTAWYSPDAGLDTGISSTKALPIDSPKVVRHGIPAPDPVHPQIAFAIIAIMIAAWSVRPQLSLGRIPSRTGSQVCCSAFLSPQAFLRPPPIL